MKKAATAFPGILSTQGTLLMDARMIELVADLMHDTAFFIKDASGRYLVVNQSLVERHGLKHKSQMLGRRPCDVCPGDYGRIPTEQDEQVLRTGRPVIGNVVGSGTATIRPFWAGFRPRSLEMATPSGPRITQTMKLRSK